MFNDNSVVSACPPQQSMTTSQGKLSFRSRGEGEVVIFLHGLLGSSKAWAFQFAGLSPYYHVAAWDAPGYGESTLVPAEIDAYVQALREFAGQYDGEKITLVGHSMGGTVASRYAVRYPDKVQRLVLSCTHPGYGAPESTPVSEKLEQRLRELSEIGPKAYGWNRARDLLPFPGIPAGGDDLCRLYCRRGPTRKGSGAPPECCSLPITGRCCRR